MPCFSSCVKQLDANGDLCFVQASGNWVVVRDRFSSSAEGYRYYAIDNSPGGIRTDKATIKFAYLIKQDGTVDLEKRWAAKILTGGPAKTRPLAASEAGILKILNEDVAKAEMAFQQQVVLSWFHAGDPLIDLNLRLSDNVVTGLSLGDRLKLIVQIAEQFEYMHDQGIIHRDAKGSNIIVDKSKVKATVIDYGSAISLNPGETRRANILAGMSLEALPPEVFGDGGRDNVCANVRLDEECGYVGKKSDVYPLAPVFRAILGDPQPYLLSSENIVNGEHVNRQELIKHQKQLWPQHMVIFARNFQNNEMSINKLTFKLPASNQSCAFVNIKQDRAPCDKYILARVAVDPNKDYYIYYEDQLLYASAGKMRGRNRQKTVDFKRRTIEISKIITTDKLSSLDLNQCIAASPGHNIDSKPIDPLVKKWICDFITKMMSPEINDRPNAFQVRSFFEAAAKVACLSEQGSKKDKSQHPLWRVQHQREIEILLLKMKIFSLGLFNTELNLDAVLEETSLSAIVSDYDFSRMGDEEQGQAFLNISEALPIWSVKESSSSTLPHAINIIRGNLRPISKRKHTAYTIVKQMRSEDMFHPQAFNGNGNKAADEYLAGHHGSGFYAYLSRFLNSFDDQEIINLQELIQQKKVPTIAIVACIRKKQPKDCDYKTKLQFWEHYKSIKAMIKSEASWLDKMFNPEFKKSFKQDGTFKRLVTLLQDDENIEVPPNLELRLSLIHSKRDLVQKYELLTEEELNELLNKTGAIIRSHLIRLKNLVTRWRVTPDNPTIKRKQQKKLNLIKRVTDCILPTHNGESKQHEPDTLTTQERVGITLTTEERMDIKKAFPELHDLVNPYCLLQGKGDLQERKSCLVM